MAPLTQTEREELTSQVSDLLAKTDQFACSSLTELSGGSVNFVFRGVLIKPTTGHNYPAESSAPSTVSTIIVRRSTAFSVLNRDFPIDVSRFVVEETMLRALDSLGQNFRAPSGTTVRTPRLYMRSLETNTQVLEDFADTIDLKSLLVSPNANVVFTSSVASSIGRDLGSWLRAFHVWAGEKAQASLLTEISQNDAMRKLKCQVTYDSFVNVLGNFPELSLSEGNDATLEDVRNMATEDFKRAAGAEGDEDWGLIHGDFWSGNVLLPNTTLSSETQQSNKPNELFVIDWEMAQFGHRSYDLGQMIGDLYERKHFKGVKSAIPAIQGFVDGYGGLSDDMAFRIAIHTGVHLIGWYTRRPPESPLGCPLEQAAAGMKFGRDLIIKGWERDRGWFESSELACLFGSKKL
ncbi:kinase-like domain-containing protein [Podospora appendiculata]|uniref:Kinase-like domain-containing protein n=1 Tax=Podospora appendiculata TaxID=314037 RepID=A0AAE1CDA2_9PEZI|nr:kinase-like domain-containing protein [Podospora appendiculata]KAK3689508.1 kinase-like domain-containing protein [Podospora appendiculata]